MVPRACLDTVEKTKIFPCRESIPGRPACSPMLSGLSYPKWSVTVHHHSILTYLRDEQLDNQFYYTQYTRCVPNVMKYIFSRAPTGRSALEPVGLGGEAFSFTAQPRSVCSHARYAPSKALKLLSRPLG
jgi:hypothetical protein